MSTGTERLRPTHSGVVTVKVIRQVRAGRGRCSAWKRPVSPRAADGCGSILNRWPPRLTRCRLFTVGRRRVIWPAPGQRRDPEPARARSCKRMVAAAPAGQNPVEDEVLHGLSTEQATALAADPSRDQAEVAALRVIAGRDTPAVARKPGESPGRCVWPRAAARGPGR